MNLPDRIKKLTETFDYNLETYKKGSYNETQVRCRFSNYLNRKFLIKLNNKDCFQIKLNGADR